VAARRVSAGTRDLGRLKVAWHAGLEELPAAGRGFLGGRVAARLGCHRTGGSCLAWCLPRCHDLSPCPEASVCPAGPAPHPNSWPQCLGEPGLPGLCWNGWERSPPSSFSSSPGNAASAACRVLPPALSRAIGVEQPRGAAKGTGSVGARRAQTPFPGPGWGTRGGAAFLQASPAPAAWPCFGAPHPYAR